MFFVFDAGANCTKVDTRIETVNAEKGYFPGVNQADQPYQFFECLNDACLGDGLCAVGYTGDQIYILCFHVFIFI